MELKNRTRTWIEPKPGRMIKELPRTRPLIMLSTREKSGGYWCPISMNTGSIIDTRRASTYHLEPRNF
jgi:hypothetical protein